MQRDPQRFGLCFSCHTQKVIQSYRMDNDLDVKCTVIRPDELEVEVASGVLDRRPRYQDRKGNAVIDIPTHYALS